jgi:hypothetical protein
MIPLLPYIGWVCLVLGTLLCLGCREPVVVASKVDAPPAGP